MYSEDEFLTLSGIQHFVFCRRQWALIHIEQMWEDNVLTVLGDMMHECAHNEALRERRGDTLIVRGLVVRSARLGVWGKCDVVEFHRCAAGHPLDGEDGLWLATPVEYKRGKSKVGDEDRMQLAAQAMCLEEMFACDLESSYLFYGATKSREKVELGSALRERVESAVQEMHDLYARRHVPKVKRGGGCRSCSLAERCMPKVVGKPVESYLQKMLDGKR